MKLKTEAFTSGAGTRIYRIPMQLFPELWGYAHLVVSDGFVALVDVGSGFGDSNDHLELGLEAVRNDFGEAVKWSDLTHILITHAHIDHFGGLAYVRQRSSAPIGIHELDRRVLTAYEERLATVANKLSTYLTEAGVTAQEHGDLMDLYLLGKQLYASQPVEFTLGTQIGPLDITHVPGHTPGQVMILVDDVLLSADHILQRISPHLAPESLTLTTGLDHYLRSLELSKVLIERTKLVLGGHERPFQNLSERIDETRTLYEDRLAQVLDLAHTPMSVAEFSQELFGDTVGYHRLLALEEAGAYVEYLSLRGTLRVDDLEKLEGRELSAIRYQNEDGWNSDKSSVEPTAEGENKVGEFDVRI